MPKEFIIDQYDGKKPVCIAVAHSAIIKHLHGDAWRDEYEEACAVLAHLLPQVRVRRTMHTLTRARTCAGDADAHSLLFRK